MCQAPGCLSCSDLGRAQNTHPTHRDQARTVFPPCCLTYDQTMVEVMKIMATSFKRSHALTAATSASDPEAGHCRPTPPPETPGYSWACLGQSVMGSLLLGEVTFSWVLGCTRFYLCPPESVSAVLRKFWQLCGGVNGNFLQEGLCHTHSPCGRHC